jgi:prefoldin subunit 5
VQPVADVATPAAVDQQTSQLGAKLDAISSALGQVKAAIDSVRSAVDGLKRSGATAGG